MSRVETLKGAGARSTATKPRGAAGFGLGTTERVPDATAVVGTATIAATSLALLQGEPSREAERRDAAARNRGEAMLQELDGLQRMLVVGAGDRSAERARLERLTTLATGDDGADPGLRAVLRDISVRAAVELARRDF